MASPPAENLRLLHHGQQHGEDLRRQTAHQEVHVEVVQQTAKTTVAVETEKAVQYKVKAKSAQYTKAMKAQMPGQVTCSAATR